MDYTKIMDERQAHLHEHFPSSSYLGDPNRVKKLLDWMTFWRRNPSRFVQYYFGILMHDGKPVCAVFSSCAHEYFAQDDDGQGLLRGQLVHAIKSTLAKTDDLHQERWDKIWDDPRCQKYKNEDREDYWLWNHDFYNAEIDDLKYIAKLIGAKEVK